MLPHQAVKIGGNTVLEVATSTTPEVERAAARLRDARSHQAPKVVHVVPELPTSAAGKIDKRVLRMSSGSTKPER